MAWPWKGDSIQVFGCNGRPKVLVVRVWVSFDSLWHAFFSLVDALWEGVEIPPDCQVVFVRAHAPHFGKVDLGWRRALALYYKIVKGIEVWRSTPCDWWLFLDGDYFPTRRSGLQDVVNFLNSLPPDVNLVMRQIPLRCLNWEGIFYLGVGSSKRFLSSYYTHHIPDSPLACRSALLPMWDSLVLSFSEVFDRYASYEALRDAIFNSQIVETEHIKIGSFPPSVICSVGLTGFVPLEEVISSAALCGFMGPNIQPQVFSALVAQLQKR